MCISMIDIAFLGTGGNMPLPHRFLSSLLISYKGRKILIDCGEGTQVSMRMLKWGFKSIDLILITHEHGDHILGLPGLLSTIGNSGREEPVTIIGPAGIKKIIEGLLLSIKYSPFDIQIVEVGEQTLALDFTEEGVSIREGMENDDFCDLIISTLELDHSVACLGYSLYVPRKPKFSVDKANANGVPKEIWKKLQNGKSIVYEGVYYEPGMVLEGKRRGIKISYITDTRPDDRIPSFIENSDLFICEGTYGHDEDMEKARRNKHMTFSEAAGLACRARVGELILTHFSPSLEEPGLYIENARKIFENSMVAYDRLVKSINYNER